MSETQETIELLAKKPTLADAKLKVMAWGESGSGKTRFALSFPAPIVADLERGSSLYAGQFDFLVAEPSAKLPGPALIKALVDQINAGAYPDRKTLIIDPVTDYLDYLEDALIQQKVKDGIVLANLKGPLQAKFRHDIKDGLRRRLDEILRLDMNIVFVARSKNEWKGSEVTGRTYDAGEIVEYLCDVVLLMKKGGTAEVKKSRLASLPDSIKVATYADLRQALMSAPAGEKPMTEAQSDEAQAKMGSWGAAESDDWRALDALNSGEKLTPAFKETLIRKAAGEVGLLASEVADLLKTKGIGPSYRTLKDTEVRQLIEFELQDYARELADRARDTEAVA